MTTPSANASVFSLWRFSKQAASVYQCKRLCNSDNTSKPTTHHMAFPHVLIGHVWRRTHHLLRARVRLLARPQLAVVAIVLARRAEVGQLGDGLVVDLRAREALDEHILTLYIAMDHRLRLQTVQVHERAAQRHDDRHPLLPTERWLGDEALVEGHGHAFQ